MDSQRTCVPGDRCETDFAEEERTVLPQLRVEAAAKKMMMVGIVEMENQAIRIM